MFNIYLPLGLFVFSFYILLTALTAFPKFGEKLEFYLNTVHNKITSSSILIPI